MQLDELGLNRNLIKDDGTSNVSSDDAAVQNSMTPGSTSSGSDESAAPGLLTGTVITACLFRSTDQPNKIEIANNDMTLYDATVGGGGTVTGDSSSISFLKSRNPKYGFVMRARAGMNNDKETVFELYGLTPEDSLYPNYIFLGRNGRSTVNDETGYIGMNANIVSADPAAAKNGSFSVAISHDGIDSVSSSIWAGDSRLIGLGAGGTSAWMMGSGTNGLTGLGHVTLGGLTFYVDATGTKISGTMLPDAGSTYDIGGIGSAIKNIFVDVLTVNTSGSVGGVTMGSSALGCSTAAIGGVYIGSSAIGTPSAKVTLYGTHVACPLPTVPDALEIIDKIPEPTNIGDRGHFGDRLYFDDLTFPEEVLHEIDGKKEIELTMVTGLLIKAVKELSQKVKDLEQEICNKQDLII